MKRLFVEGWFCWLMMGLWTCVAGRSVSRGDWYGALLALGLVTLYYLAGRQIEKEP